MYLGTFVDDPDDLPHVERLREWSADVFAVSIDPRRARTASLLAFERKWAERADSSTFVIEAEDLRYADGVVAPLRVARGIQNKVFEAMSMARPVVVSAAATSWLGGDAERDLLTAASADEFVERIDRLIAKCGWSEIIGRHARE